MFASAESPEKLHRKKSNSLHAETNNVRTWNTDELWDKSETVFGQSDAAFDYEQARIALLDRHRRETQKLRQHQGKIFYENNILCSNLELRNYAANSKADWNSVEKWAAKAKIDNKLRKEAIEAQKSSLKTKLIDTDAAIERIRELQKYAEKTLKSTTDKKRFNIYQSRQEASELRTHNKRLKDSLKMKTVSLTILRNETNKCLADIEDEKKNYNIRISRVEREIEHVNDQVRNLR